VFPDGKNPDGTDRVKVVKVKDGLKSINTLRLLVADLFTYPLTDKEDKMKRNGALYVFLTMVTWRVADRGQGGTTSRVRLLSLTRLMGWEVTSVRSLTAVLNMRSLPITVSAGGLEQPHNTIHLLTGGHGHMVCHVMNVVYLTRR
jgi:hypothetical protein